MNNLILSVPPAPSWYREGSPPGIAASVRFRWRLTPTRPEEVSTAVIRSEQPQVRSRWRTITDSTLCPQQMIEE